MANIQNLLITKKPLEKETLQIDLNSGVVHLAVRIIRFIDRDTGYIVYYVPSLELSGYGNIEKEAFDMLEFSIEDFFDFLSKLPPKGMEAELIKFGWNRKQLNEKEFSRVFIDPNGDLEELGDSADQIETLTIEA